MKRKKTLSKLLLTALITILSTSQVSAVSLDLQLNSTEYINGLIFYSDGSHTLTNAKGSLLITNPSLNLTVSDINIDFTGSITPASIHINSIGPNTTQVVSYQVDGSMIKIPLSVFETFTPEILKPEVNQTIVFNVSIYNSGGENVSIVLFDKTFPPELIFLNLSATVGAASVVSNNLTWADFTILPGTSEHVLLTFYTTPTSDIPIPSSNLVFSVPSYSASKALSLSAVTTTNFTLEKERITNDRWRVGVRVWDETEFNFSLHGVEVYLSDPQLNESVMIKNYSLNVNLKPGESWYDNFLYNYSSVPVFFTRVYYSIPSDLSGLSLPMTPVKSGGFILKSTVTGSPDKSHHVVRVIKSGNDEEETEPYADDIPPIEVVQGKSSNQDTSHQENNLPEINLPEIIGVIISIVLVSSLFWILFNKK